MFSMMKRHHKAHSMLFWLGAMGGLAAIASGVWAIVKTMRHREYDMSYMEDDSIPSVT